MQHLSIMQVVPFVEKRHASGTSWSGDLARRKLHLHQINMNLIGLKEEMIMETEGSATPENSRQQTVPICCRNALSSAAERKHLLLSKHKLPSIVRVFDWQHPVVFWDFETEP